MSDLPTRTLGRTALDVTVLGYGAMELRDPPRGREIAEHDAERILNAVLDRGINFVDTSIDYGLSEERIGRYIAHRRDEYVLASKCGCVVGYEFTEDRVGPHDYGAANVVAGVEQSLRRMRTDHLDLVQLHLSPSVELLEQEATLETLAALRDQGKVRFIGMSGTLPHLPHQIDAGAFDVFQIPYSALDRTHEDLMSRAAAADAGVVIRGGAANGVPGGNSRGLERHADLADAWARADLDDLLDGLTPMEFVLRFTISHPRLSTAIVGTVNPDHLDANVAAVRAGPLPAELYDEAKRRLDAAGIAPARDGA